MERLEDLSIRGYQTVQSGKMYGRKKKIKDPGFREKKAAELLIIYRNSWPDQRRIYSTLSNMACSLLQADNPPGEVEQMLSCLPRHTLDQIASGPEAVESLVKGFIFAPPGSGASEGDKVLQIGCGIISPRYFDKMMRRSHDPYDKILTRLVLSGESPPGYGQRWLINLSINEGKLPRPWKVFGAYEGKFIENRPISSRQFLEAQACVEAIYDDINSPEQLSKIFDASSLNEKGLCAALAYSLVVSSVLKPGATIL